MKKTRVYGLKERLGSYINGPGPNLALKSLILSTLAPLNGHSFMEYGIRLLSSLNLIIIRVFELFSKVYK